MKIVAWAALVLAIGCGDNERTGAGPHLVHLHELRARRVAVLGRGAGVKNTSPSSIAAPIRTRRGT